MRTRFAIAEQVKDFADIQAETVFRLKRARG